MFTQGERVYWVQHGLRRLGTIEASSPQCLKAKVRPAARGSELQELEVRRLYHAPPEEQAGRVLQRDYASPFDKAAIDLATREASFIASDGSVDRFGDILDPAGWDLRAFKRNPVFLWQHDVTAPIGTVPNVAVRDEKLVARAKWIDQGIAPLADQLFRLVAAGQLCAVSIGARSLAEPEPIRDKQENITGFKYGAMELLELSLVSIPANPNALVLGRSLGLEDGVLQQVFEVDAPVANLAAYYTRLRARVPGLLMPRPAKPTQLSPERDP